MSRVNVLIRCYKYGHLLRDCARSVLSREGVGVRVPIIDDASPDDTEVLARELAWLDGRVEYRQHSVNQGQIATYNEGLEWAARDEEGPAFTSGSHRIRATILIVLTRH
jgi:glycosyltransferase involved in cell wall biosynthesis